MIDSVIRVSKKYYYQILLDRMQTWNKKGQNGKFY